MGIQADRHWSAVLAVATVPIHTVEGDDARYAEETGYLGFNDFVEDAESENVGNTLLL